MQVQAHNVRAATVWGSGSRGYDKVSEYIADSIEHMLNRIDVQPDERVLDLATGTGWTARRLAQKGAQVAGVDIGRGVIAAARHFASEANLEIDFQVGDAEQIELPDAAFEREFVAFHEAYRTEMGIAMPRDYLVIIGIRR